MAWILLRPSNYKQVAPLVRTGGSRHTGLAALPHRNIHILKLSDVRMTQEYRIEVEKSLERNKDFCNAFERLNMTNQELVVRLMEQLDEGQN